jgi:hypothetical protein
MLRTGRSGLNSTRGRCGFPIYHKVQDDCGTDGAFGTRSSGVKAAEREAKQRL